MTSVHKPADRFHAETNPIRWLRLRRSVGGRGITHRVVHQAKAAPVLNVAQCWVVWCVFGAGAIERD